MSALWISSQRQVLAAPRVLVHHAAPALRHLHLSSSAVLSAEGGLTPRNWGAPRGKAGGNNSGGRADGESSWSRPPRDGQRRDGGGAGRGGRGGRGGGARQGDRDGGQRERGGGFAPSGPTGFGLKGQQGQATGGDKWAPRTNRNAGTSDNRQSRGGGAAPASNEPRRTFERQPAPSRFESSFDNSYADEDLGGRGGRRGRQQRESRSLLNQDADEAELPGSHHHSIRGKHDKKSRAERNHRQWASEEDDVVDEAEAQRALRELERVREKRRAEAAKAARLKKEAKEKDVFIPATITVAQLAEKFGVKIGT